MSAEDTPPSEMRSRIQMFLAVLIGCGLAAWAFVVAMAWLKSRHAPLWQTMGAAAVYAALVLAIAAIFIGRMAKLTDIRQSPAVKRYAKRIMGVAMAYCLVLLAAVYVFASLRPVGPLAFVMALAPAIPAAGFVVAIGLYLHEETDEYWRKIQVEGLLIGVGGAIILATAWGFLETFRQVPHLPLWLIGPVCAALTGPSQLLLQRRYR